MWEYVVGVMSEPVRTLREIAEQKLWKKGLLLLAALAILNGAVTAATVNSSQISIPDQQLSHFFSAFYAPGEFIPFVLVVNSLSWLINGAIFYGFSKLFKGTGTFAGMLAALGFTTAPSLLSIILTALALLFGQATGSLVGFAASLVAGIWILVLEVLAIRESQQLDTGQAVGVLLSTLAAIFALVVIIAFLIAIFSGITAAAPGSAVG
jgi:hypothetical protein